MRATSRTDDCASHVSSRGQKLTSSEGFSPPSRVYAPAAKFGWTFGTRQAPPPVLNRPQERGGFGLVSGRGKRSGPRAPAASNLQLLTSLKATFCASRATSPLVASSATGTSFTVR